MSIHLDNSLSDCDDARLVRFIRKGNHAAFAELVTRHTDRFFALAFRTLQHQGDAEDVVQSAFVKFWERPHLWQADKSKFTTWFYRVVINACHDLQRRGQREVWTEPETLALVLPSTPSEEAQAEQAETENWRRYCLESGVRELPMSQRDALNLVVYCELPQRQAAEVLGVSVKALESLLVRAKRSLAQHISRLELLSTQTGIAPGQPSGQLKEVINVR